MLARERRGTNFECLSERGKGKIDWVEAKASSIRSEINFKCYLNVLLCYQKRLTRRRSASSCLHPRFFSTSQKEQTRVMIVSDGFVILSKNLGRELHFQER